LCHWKSVNCSAGSSAVSRVAHPTAKAAVTATATDQCRTIAPSPNDVRVLRHMSRPVGRGRPVHRRAQRNSISKSAKFE
jgi:hypothetical protein